MRWIISVQCNNPHNRRTCGPFYSPVSWYKGKLIQQINKNGAKSLRIPKRTFQRELVFREQISQPAKQGIHKPLSNPSGFQKSHCTNCGQLSVGICLWENLSDKLFLLKYLFPVESLGIFRGTHIFRMQLSVPKVCPIFQFHVFCFTILE